MTCNSDDKCCTGGLDIKIHREHSGLQKGILRLLGAVIENEQACAWLASSNQDANPDADRHGEAATHRLREALALRLSTLYAYTVPGT